MFSPPRREKARLDTLDLPKGNCRYILLHPENSGIRCACVGFTLNRSIPGSLCDCGHQACFHLTENKETSAGDKMEVEELKARVRMLEHELDKERRGGGGGLVDRLSRLEELVDRNREEGASETKALYRGMEGIWHHIGLWNKRAPYYDDTIEGLVDDVHRMRNQLIEVDHASIRVEERVESLENSGAAIPILSRRRRASTPPSVIDDVEQSIERRGRPSPRDRETSIYRDMNDEDPNVRSFRERVSSVGSDPEAWTVHVSLLPTYSQPFPFEKDTAAYKRCLSRGLHQVIVIPDATSFSFRTAISDAFQHILHGRQWQPLVAQLCNAKNLRGLPMLRQLERHLVDMDYNMEFLERNCAVVDDSGKILDLYIAMSEETLSWVELKDISPFKPGLEAAWVYDPLLDGPCMDSVTSSTARQTHDSNDRRPAAGDLVPNFFETQSLKRSASEISRTPSFGSSADADGTRAKMRRQCTASNVDIVGRRAEAV
ncbi:hypothetical protein GLAREA_04526 [Glarea lozoyensis ATCC 20868]|uniref:Uncharacterized protein n=1 Tax=Glarea lozoyensis (strain ATCC 20868 / MF5171) TaxID=1116229 RepID=S3CPX1_GLAL2|nr:uncharacterized protein GLAREA_04526 [Glarea lozoyensis ATCC 20868]EPE27735.1 hypothetical protein GLAREA_04526 [Glarea lozoyensis ATCC 20868]